MSDLTIFIITTGEESLDECVEAIRKQDMGSGARVEVIRGLYPMFRAFNEMHRRCKTPYFIQVDADMILNRDAVGTLYRAIKRSGLMVYAAYGQLYEEGFGPGGSVRCWKRGIFKLFKFRDVRTTDRDFYKRAMLLGLRRINVNKTLGIHRPRQSYFSDYLKTKGDLEKWQFLKRPFDRYADKLYQDLIREPHNNRYKILGFSLGTLASKKRVSRSKDTRTEAERIEAIFCDLGRDFKEFRVPESADFARLFNLTKKAYLDYSPARKRVFTEEVLKELFNLDRDNSDLERLYQKVTT